MFYLALNTYINYVKVGKQADLRTSIERRIYKTSSRKENSPLENVAIDSSKLRSEMNRTKVSHKISLMKSSGNHLLFYLYFT
jgi:hypothetical protein